MIHPRTALTPLLALALLLSGGAAARAQFGQADGTISGAGTVTISRQPERMRVQVVLQGKGGTTKEALAAVKKRGDAAQKQLVGFGAEKDSIKVENPRIMTLQNDPRQQQRMQMMMMRRMQQQPGGKKEAKKKVAEPVMVSAMLTAEIKLDAKGPDDLLLASHALQEQIKEADLGGAKDAEKLSPEQEELLEEQEAEMMNLSNDNEPKPGEPVFLFVSKISEAERDKALAEAFQKAKAQAKQLAKAAGIELGNLKTLYATNASAGGYDRYGSYNYNYNRIMQMAQRSQSGEDLEDPDSTTAFAAEAGPVKLSITVTAAFEAKSGK